MRPLHAPGRSSPLTSTRGCRCAVQRARRHRPRPLLAPRRTARLELPVALRNLDALRVATAAAVGGSRVRAEATPARSTPCATTARPGPSPSGCPTARPSAHADRRSAARDLLALRNKLVVAQLDLNLAVAGRLPSTRTAHPPAARIDEIAAELAGRLASGALPSTIRAPPHRRSRTGRPRRRRGEALRRRLADAKVEQIARADRASALEPRPRSPNTRHQRRRPAHSGWRAARAVLASAADHDGLPAREAG